VKVIFFATLTANFSKL